MADPIYGPYGSPIIDNFDRADGDPGVDWVAPFWTGEAKPSISGNRIDAGGYPQTTWKAMRRAVPLNHENCEVWAVPSSTSFMNLYARAASLIYPSGGGYQVSCLFPDGYEYIKRKINGTDLRLAGGWEAGQSALSGSPPIALSCIGSLLEAYYWDGAAWVLKCSVTDTYWAGAAYLGMDITGTLDNFGGGVLAPVNTVLPVVSGTYAPGETISVSNGSWSTPFGHPVSAYTYQWRRYNAYCTAYTDISGATSGTYVLTADDMAYNIRCWVRATNGLGYMESVSAIPPVSNLRLPSIYGLAKENWVLSVDPGEWANAPTSVAYQWRRCDSAGASCSDIPGATLSSYRCAAADVGSTIRVAVTATNPA